MLTLRPSRERGHANHGWLDTYHTFSFADYHDPAHMGFRSLRVINEDFVEPAHGFGTHAHRDMEIVTCVLEGELEHKDSMGTGSVIRPGELQYMSAGSGVTHSEFNPSKTSRLHLMQIWILPNLGGAKPRYDQKNFAQRLAPGKLTLVASPDGRDDSIAIRQDARILRGTFDAKPDASDASATRSASATSYALASGRHAWVQVTSGKLRVNDLELSAGDGLAASNEAVLSFQAAGRAEILLFDLA